MILPTAILLCLAFLKATTSALVPPCHYCHSSRQRAAALVVVSASKPDNNVFDNDDDNNDNNDEPKLGINIGSMLDPFTPEEAQALKAEASELISDAVAQGVDDIQALRAQLKNENLEASKERLRQSEKNAELASQTLLKKIDKLTDGFLKTSQSMRDSTKRAAAADASMEGKGAELGSWGTLGGAAVATGLLGSVASATQKVVNRGNFYCRCCGSGGESYPHSSRPDAGMSRLAVCCDALQHTCTRHLITQTCSSTHKDPLAKALIPAFTDLMQEAGVDVQVLKPTQTMPLGADNAACLVCFATSLSNPSSLKNMFDRLLRRTLLGNGKMGTPPTQLVCVSTLGTERTNKMPYSLQNMLGGKLEKRRQLEEVVINTVKNRVVQPPLDYTIVKVGELKDSSPDNWQLLPGDVLDGSTSVDLAAQVLVQAVAFQPFARNATLGVVGGAAPNQDISEKEWDDAFLRLDGPELVRFEHGLGDVSKYDQLNEYLGEWALMMESDKQKLTTPIRVETRPSSKPSHGVEARAGVRLVFLPTNTGTAYMSRDEEKQRESERGGGSSSGSTTKKRLSQQQGGVEVLVEITSQDSLRVRARRCNMADDTVLKELSEATILKRLEDCIDVWKNDIIS